MNKVNRLVAYVEEHTQLKDTLYQLRNLSNDISPEHGNVKIKISFGDSIKSDNSYLNRSIVDLAVQEYQRRLDLVESKIGEAESCLEEL